MRLACPPPFNGSSRASPKEAKYPLISISLLTWAGFRMKSKPQFSGLCKRLSPTYIGTPEAPPPAYGSTVILVKSGLKSRTKEKAFLKRVSEIYPRQTAQAWEFRACESGSGSLEDACTLIPDRGGRPSSPPCQPRRSLPFRSPILRLQRSRPKRLRRLHPSRLSLQLSAARSEEHTSELQSRGHLVCRLLLEKKNNGLRLVAYSAPLC